MLKMISDYARIAAILPTYTAAGDATTIIDMTGDKQPNRTRIFTVIRNLARNQAIDLVALKRNAANATESRILQPLSFAPGCVLFPLKVRNPLVPGDPCMGYINFHAVTSVTAHHDKLYQSMVTLIGGTEVPVIWKPATVKKHLRHVKLAIACTASAPIMHPELMLIAQKQTEFYSDLLAFCARLFKKDEDKDKDNDKDNHKDK